MRPRSIISATTETTRMTASRRPEKPAPSRVPVLPGFGPKTTSALAAVGVSTLDGLLARDPYELYGDLKAADPTVSLNFLYAILAAQEGRDWREIQKTRRTEILLKLDEIGLAPK